MSVIGAAGIGKTRLAWEFLKYVDGVLETVLVARRAEPRLRRGHQFWALGEMVRGRCGLLETDDESTTRTKVAATIAEYVPDVDERRWIEPALLTLLGIESGIGSEQLFGAWRTFFERLATTGPVVMVFEDFHLADSGLLDFVDHLLDWSRTGPIYVVTLARPELLGPPARLGRGQANVHLASISSRSTIVPCANSWPAWSPAFPTSRHARSWREPMASRCTPSRPSGCSWPMAGWPSTTAHTVPSATSRRWPSRPRSPR